MQELIISRDQISKEEINNRVELIKHNIKLGLMDSLDVNIHARALKMMCDELIKCTESDTKAELQKYHKDERVFGGITYQFSSTGERLDYAKDHVIAELENKLKERKGLVKIASKSKEQYFDSEGVEVTKVPIKTPSKEVLKATIK